MVVSMSDQISRSSIDGEEPCIVLALGGSGTHVGRDGEAFQSWDATEGDAPRDVPLPPDA
jgi:hypothetical protein